MTLTLDDVRNKRFRMARKSGYEVLEVDEFVDEVEESFAQLLEEGAFGDTVPNLDQCCKSPRAYQGMLELKSAIVRAGGTEHTDR